jgi:hypothetical protein
MQFLQVRGFVMCIILGANYRIRPTDGEPVYRPPRCRDGPLGIATPTGQVSKLIKRGRAAAISPFDC